MVHRRSSAILFYGEENFELDERIRELTASIDELDGGLGLFQQALRIERRKLVNRKLIVLNLLDSLIEEAH